MPPKNGDDESSSKPKGNSKRKLKAKTKKLCSISKSLAASPHILYQNPYTANGIDIYRTDTPLSHNKNFSTNDINSEGNTNLNYAYNSDAIYAYVAGEYSNVNKSTDAKQYASFNGFHMSTYTDHDNIPLSPGLKDHLYTGDMPLVPEQFYSYNGANGYSAHSAFEKTPIDLRCYMHPGIKRHYTEAPYEINPNISILPDSEVLAARHAELYKCQVYTDQDVTPEYATANSSYSNKTHPANNNYMDLYTNPHHHDITDDNYQTIVIDHPSYDMFTITTSIPLDPPEDSNVPIITAHLDDPNSSETNLEDILLCDEYREKNDCESNATFEPVSAGEPLLEIDISEPIHKHVNYNFCLQVAKSASTSTRGIVNLKERIRTSNINDAYSSLRQVIPTTPDTKKLTKIEIVRLAMSYIAHLGIKVRLGSQFENCATSTISHKNKRLHICPFCKAPVPENDKNFRYEQQKCRYIYNKRRLHIDE